MPCNRGVCLKSVCLVCLKMKTPKPENQILMYESVKGMSEPQKKILLVEDDSNLGFVIKDTLSAKGYQVTWAKDGEEGYRFFLNEDFRLCLVDVMLPKKDGFTLSRQIRAVNADVPILLLTAKSMTEDKLEGFRSGADDYITKPFSIEELILRMEVFLRRAGQAVPDNIYRIGQYTFDFRNLTLSHETAGSKILTAREAEVLRLLCEHKNQMVKRAQILRKVWGDDDYFMGRSMDVFISKLRKYLKEDDSLQIVNHHGVGFRLEVGNGN